MRYRCPLADFIEGTVDEVHGEEWMAGSFPAGKICL